MLGQHPLPLILTGLLSLGSGTTEQPGWAEPTQPTAFPGLSQLCTKDKVNTCQDCVSSGPGCAWCQKLNFTRPGEPESSRCDTPEQLLLKGCTPEYLVYPKSLAEPQEDKDRDQKQLSPQNVTLYLRPGQAAEFTVDVQWTQDNSVDLYFLLALSGSTQGHLPSVQTLGRDLLQGLNEITRSGHIGFGSIRNMTFQNILKLTDDSSQFQSELGKQQVSGNPDTRKGQLDAMMQVAMCLGEIGWRNGTRFLVLATDNDFHLAEDKNPGTRQNSSDRHCLIEDGVYKSQGEPDEQSVPQLARRLAENNVHPILLVPSRTVRAYERLTTFIPTLAIGELTDESRKVALLIKDAYSKVSSRVFLTHTTIPSTLKVTYKSFCRDRASNTSKSGGDCDGVQMNDKVTFQVSVTASECIQELFVIRALGLTDTVTVQVLPQCQCLCQDQSQNSFCGDQGTMECGICRCNSGYTGKNCECLMQGRSSEELERDCRKDGSSRVCSGLGDCICGQCVCHTSDVWGKVIYGKYCECDNLNCERYDGQVCGGPNRGSCDCGQCNCKEGFEGSACQCLKSTQGCLNKELVECSGHGRCHCNRCQCDLGYHPPLCEEIRNHVPSRCSEYIICAECLSGNKKWCFGECGNLMSPVFEIKTCSIQDSKGCWKTYTRHYRDRSETPPIYIEESTECPGITTMLVSIAAGVLFIIILILVFWIIHLKETQRTEVFTKDKTEGTLKQQETGEESPWWHRERQGTS